MDEQKAMELFQEVYEDWRSRLGEATLETVKAVTMLCTVSNKLDGPAGAVKWSKMEVAIREEVQGTLHPRTHQAKRNHANLLEALAAQNARQRLADDSGGGGGNGGGDDKKEETKVKSESLDSGTSRMNALISLVDKEAGMGSKRKEDKDKGDDAQDEHGREKRIKKEHPEKGDEVLGLDEHTRVV